MFYSTLSVLESKALNHLDWNLFLESEVSRCSTFSLPSFCESWNAEKCRLTTWGCSYTLKLDRQSVGWWNAVIDSINMAQPYGSVIAHSSLEDFLIWRLSVINVNLNNSFELIWIIRYKNKRINLSSGLASWPYFKIKCYLLNLRESTWFSTNPSEWLNVSTSPGDI